MGWRITKLKDICVVDWGDTSLTKKSYIEGGKFLAVSAAGCDGRIDHADHKACTPVLSAIGAQCGRMFYPEEPFTAIKNTITLTPVADVVDNRFLFHLLTYVDLPQRGAGQPFISKGDIQSFEISIPKVPEQKRIVAILDQAFADIDKARALTEQNLKNARELFESYLQKVFSQRGEGWVRKSLAEICTFTSGGTPSKKNDAYWIGGIPWVSGRDMKGTQLSDTTLHISQSAVDESSTRMAPEGSLLILVRGMGLAHGAQVVELLRPCAFNQDIRAIHVASGIVPRFLVLALRHRINNSSNVLSNAAHGTLKIDMDQLKGLEIMLPSAEKQAIIVAKINELLASVDELGSRYQAKLESLEELKKSLLQKAFSGELTNSSAEAAA